jgi:hypothetical protein
VEVVVLVPCTKVAEAVWVLVASDTTTTVVDVLSMVSLESEGVGRFVVDMTVEVLASVDVVERTKDVGPKSEQLFVELKPVFPTTRLQMAMLVGDVGGVLSAISSLPVFVARAEPLIRAGGCWTLVENVVPIPTLSSGSGQDIVTVTVMVVLGYADITSV